MDKNTVTIEQATIAAGLMLRFKALINSDTAAALAAIPEFEREKIISRALALCDGSANFTLDTAVPIVIGQTIGELATP